MEESNETVEETETAPPPGEVTVKVDGKERRLIWERHTPSLYIMDMLMLESRVLTACAALVLAQPRMAKAAGFRRDLPAAAEKLYVLLEKRGWTADVVMKAGMHAYSWLAPQVPVTASSKEVQEEVDFSEAGPGDGSGE